VLCQQLLAFMEDIVTARHPGHARKNPARYRALALFVLVSAAFAAIFVTLALNGFHQPTPHGVPVGIAGPSAVTSQVEHALDHAAPGGFSFTSYPSEASAVTGIAHRQVDGALVASGAGLKLLVTQAGGSAPEQALIGTFTAVAAKSGHQLTVSDVIPGRPGDSQGLSSFFMALSVLIPSLAAGSASAMVFRRARRSWAVGAPAAAAIVIGLAVAGIADGIDGLGNYPALAGILTLFSLAISAPTALLARIKPPLTALAVLGFLVLGLPVSGGPAVMASFAAGFLHPLFPVLPLGITAATVRSVIYFGGHGITSYLWTLAGWAVAGGVGLVLITALRRQAPAPELAMSPAGTAGLGPVLPAGALVPGQREEGTASPVALVVGFDDSEPARRALAWSADLLRARHGSLHVVYADHPLIDSDLSGFAHAEMEQDRDEKAAVVAKAAGEIAAAAGVPYTFERRREAPAEAILRGAGVQDATGSARTPVIVVGRSHHAAHQVIGSVPVKLLHESPYPVLTIS
jgi:nucleotide-binding universal stress UspA family protein